MDFLTRLIFILLGCSVVIAIFHIYIKIVTIKIIEKFLSHAQLSEQVFEKELKYDKKEEKYDVFIIFKDEPNNTYKLAFKRTGLTYILYRLNLGSLSHIRVSITAYNKISNAKIDSVQEAKYLKYDGTYCKRYNNDEQQKNRDNKKLIVRMPRFCLWVGIAGTLFFGVAIVGMTLFPNDTVTFWTYLAFGLFLHAGLLFFWISIIWRIEVEKDGFKFRNSFNQTKVIPFESIGKVRLKGRLDPDNPINMLEVVLYSKSGKVILVTTSLHVGGRLFIKRLQQESIKFE